MPGALGQDVDDEVSAAGRNIASPALGDHTGCAAALVAAIVLFDRHDIKA